MRVMVFIASALLLVGCSSTVVRPPALPTVETAIAGARHAEEAGGCNNVEDCDVPELRVIAPPGQPAAHAAAAQPEGVHTRKPVSSVAAEDVHTSAITPTSKVMAAHFINVGQGSSTLLEFPCGAVLIDTGGEDEGDFHSNTNLSDYLEEFFARRTDLSNTLDLVVLSHPHIDHTRGVAVLEDLESANHLTIRNVIDNGEERQGSGKSGQLKLRTLAPKREEIRERDITSLDGKTDSIIDPIACSAVDPQIRALWGHLSARPDFDGDGQSDWSENEWSNENNHSVVLRVDFGASSFLFMGDIQRAASDSIAESYEADTRILNVDLAVVPHHGSENGITKNLLTLISPKIAIIQAGDSSRGGTFTGFGYGHPRKKIMDLLTDSGGVSGTRNPITVPVATGQRKFVSFSLSKAIFSISWDGTIIVYANTNGQMQVVTENGD